MSIFSKLFSNKELVEGGACPNCWGDQEYDNTVRDLVKDKQLDVNNRDAKHAFIQDFVVNHVSGIHLKRGNNGYECPRCRKVHK